MSNLDGMRNAKLSHPYYENLNHLFSQEHIKYIVKKRYTLFHFIWLRLVDIKFLIYIICPSKSIQSKNQWLEILLVNYIKIVTLYKLFPCIYWKVRHENYWSWPCRIELWMIDLLNQFTPFSRLNCLQPHQKWRLFPRWNNR